MSEVWSLTLYTRKGGGGGPSGYERDYNTPPWTVKKGGPSVAMGDHIRRHGRSQGDQVFCHRRSGGTNRSAVHGPGGPILGGDQLSCDRYTKRQRSQSQKATFSTA